MRTFKRFEILLIVNNVFYSYLFLDFSIDNCMRKIVLMSDFNEQYDIISQFSADAIAEQLQAEGIQLVTMYDKFIDLCV